MGASIKHVEARRKPLLAVWDFIDETHPEWWDSKPGTTPGSKLRDAAARVARENGYVGRRYRIAEWIASPEMFSPHIDEVAMDRAMDFDWDVIDNLTAAEYVELGRRFAAMGDYGEFEGEDRGMDGDPMSGSPRRQRFRRGTLTQRKRLQMAVDRARQGSAVAA